MFKFLFVFLFAALGAANVIPNFDFVNRIVGGKNVLIEDYPYQIDIRDSDGHYCGGSILSENYIITAAHCAKFMYDSEYSVRAAVNHTDQDGTFHNIVWVKRHENFGFTEIGAPKNDIAIAKVHPPFRIDATTSPIALYYSEDEIEEGEMSVITGYGSISEGGKSSKYLLAVEVPIMSRKRCNEIYQSYVGSEVGVEFICAGTDEGGKDACSGDSGGPLVIKGQLAGIVSYGLGCARPGVPGVYTNVAHFAKWIADSMS